jgi:hypothetical protein
LLGILYETKELKKLIMAVVSQLHAPNAKPPEKSTLYSLERRLGGPQNRSGRCGEEKHLAHAGNPTPPIQPEARRDATDTRVIRMAFTPLHIYFSLEFYL